MRKLTPLFSALLLLSFGLHCASLQAEEDVLVRVNGHEITADMLAILSDSRQQGPLAELQESQAELLESLITTELLFREAKKSKLDTDKKVALELELAHKTLLSQFYVMRYMDQLAIDEATLKAAYDVQEPETIARMVFWSFDSQTAAETFLAHARSGKLDTTATGEELPWQALEHYPFAHLPETATLSAGQWLSVPVEDELGWMVWRCLETSTIPKPAFEEARDGIRQELASLRLQEHIASLRAQADIQQTIKD
jgi:hypothetical protein